MEEKIERWLESLGYIQNNELYEDIVRMSYYRPSYRVIANKVLWAIKNHNSVMESEEVWNYTTKFVNGMKSNLIINNRYFQSVFKNGLFNPISNKQFNNMKLFNTKEYFKNEYFFIKNIIISNGKNKRKFDFVLIINGFPLVLIEFFDSKNSSFEEKLFNLEDDFERFPMFFNFNKLILLTDGSTYKIGTLYDFSEEYIDFRKNCSDFIKGEKYCFDQLEELLSSKNILNFLKKNENSEQIRSYINHNLNIKKETTKKETKCVDETEIFDNMDMLSRTREEELYQSAENLDENEDLEFMTSFFNPNLSEVLESEKFKKKLDNAKEVINFNDNELYIEDFQKNKNDSTLEILIKANQRLVAKEVNKLIKYKTASLEIEDMCQLGYIGLIKAAKKFDLSAENTFSTYAVYWIRNSIIRGIQEDSLLVRIPVNKWESIFKISDLEHISEKKYNYIDYDWISKESDISKEKIIELLMIRNIFMNNHISLDTPVGIDENTTLENFIVEENNDLESIIMNMDLRNKIEEALENLDLRSKDVLIKRFGLNDQPPMTLEEIGEVYSVTRERIRQIENIALRKLRQSSRAKKYKIYYEV